MSSGQQIADIKAGTIAHIWQTDLWQKILRANPIPKGEIELGIDLAEGLPLEVLAGVIATEVYEDSRLELGNSTMKILLDVTRFAATQVEPTNEDRIVGYFGEPKYWLPQVLSVGYLARTLDRGLTPGQLQSLGVSNEVVVQLMWWQRREGESLLEQHVRAELAGWCLPAIAAGYREVWGNLFRFLDASNGAESFKEAHSEQLAEIESTLDFFGGVAKQHGVKPPVAANLAAESEPRWAKAFEPDLPALLPDLWGPFAHIPKQLIATGKLANPLATLARYLEQIGVTPEQFSSDASILARFTRNLGANAS